MMAVTLLKNIRRSNVLMLENIVQNTPEWKAEKLGKPSASRFNEILTAAGAVSKQRDGYLYDLAAQVISGIYPESFTSPAMEEGVRREEESRKLYEMIRGVTVKQVGIIYKDEAKKFLCSPDGIVGNEYGLELKNVLPRTQVKYLLAGNFPAEYHFQIQGSLFITGFKRWDFLSYSPGLPPFIIECRRDERFISALAYELDSFTNELQAMIRRLQDVSGTKEAPQAAPKGKDSLATLHAEELAPGECPLRPDTTMTKKFCEKCKDRLGCSAWVVKFKAVGE
jgi:hypothetical protein